MKLIWHGHACFQIEEDGWSVVCDPYAPGYVPGLRELSVTADDVFCSHGHDDHNYVQAVTLNGTGDRRFSVTAVDCWHDDAGGALRGPNRIHVFDLPSGLRAVHLGDLGHRLSEEQAAAIGTPDVLMIPVGGFFTIGPEDARAVCDQLKPRVIVPMHFRGRSFGFDVIGPAEDFTALFPAERVFRPDSCELEVGPDSPSGVFVLTPRLLA
ncbi:MAG: MBL fold metallo-hydrolase [Oscillospiraceae bacterium]|nr:MBL fold metallo-hydrolase [Oscillospiraceae bacterium]